MMTLHVYRTEADFREANAAYRGLRLMSFGTLPFFFLYLAFTIGVIAGNLLQEQPPGAPPRGPVDVMFSSIWLVIAGVYWGVVGLRTAGKRAHGFVRPPPPLAGVGVVTPALLAVALFAVCLLSNAYTPPAPLPAPQPTPPPLGESLRSAFLPFVPVVSLVACSIWIFLRQFNRNLTRGFQLQVQLHRPATVQASPEWFIVTDEAHQTSYRWQAFIGWQETANLFLLYNSYATFEMVPKRAFASAEQIHQFTALLRQSIGAGGVGFEVLPARPGPPPLPATTPSQTQAT
jgi:hypothetical protein